MEKIKTILSILDDVVNDRIPPDEALNSWPSLNSEEDDLLSASWHDLSHYVNDRDIREEDKEYEIILKNQLQKRIDAIRCKYP